METAQKRAADDDDSSHDADHASKRAAVDGGGTQVSGDEEESSTHAEHDAHEHDDNNYSEDNVIFNDAVAAVAAAAANSGGPPAHHASATEPAGDAIPGLAQMTVRSIVPIKLVGAVIGRNGTVIRTIREEANAKINVSENLPGSVERIVSVSGTPSAVAKAYYLIVTRWEQETQAATPGAVNPSLKLCVPNSQIGGIIGKAGSRIKELQENSGARVNISEEVLPQSTERAVTLTGAGPTIHKAVFEICGRLQESPERGHTISFRPTVRAGGAAPTARAPDQATGYAAAAPVAYPPPGAPGVPPSAAAAGAAAAMAAYPGYGQPTAGAPAYTAAAAYSANPYAAYPGYAGYAAPAGFAFPGQPPAAAPSAPAGGTSQSMMVTPDQAGAIIGRAGQRINEIRQLSGSQIRISETLPNGRERTLTVTGTAEGVQYAMYLIHQRLSMDSENRPKQ